MCWSNCGEEPSEWGEKEKIEGWEEKDMRVRSEAGTEEEEGGGLEEMRRKKRFLPTWRSPLSIRPGLTVPALPLASCPHTPLHWPRPPQKSRWPPASGLWSANGLHQARPAQELWLHVEREKEEVEVERE